MNKKHSIDHVKAMFKKKHGYELNLEKPQTISEKIQWLKFYGNLERFAKYVDKYEVRKFVIERIGSQYLVPLIGVYQKVDDIDITSLPNAFVLKATHGSSWYVIVKNMRELDWPAASAKANEWLRMNYYTKTGEPNYKPLTGRLIIEELLQDPTGDLKDYKFFCFHGRTMYIQVDGDRFTDHKRDLYDLEWNRLPCVYYYKNFPEPVEKPKCLTEMIEIVRRLAHGFPFVRVDLYYTNNRIYFGELTFTPTGGYKPLTFKYDLMLGELLDLKKYIEE